MINWDEGQDWSGYIGTHKLTYGWRKVVSLFPNHEVIFSDGICKLFKLKA